MRRMRGVLLGVREGVGAVVVVGGGGGDDFEVVAAEDALDERKGRKQVSLISISIRRSSSGRVLDFLRQDGGWREGQNLSHHLL